MTGDMLGLVARAQGGDEDAHREVAVFCFNKYRHRLKKLYDPIDPAIGMEDLEMTFFEGIMQAVLIADHRGDPLYHIGQRGFWNVQSEIRAVKRVMARRQHLVREHETDLDPLDQVPDDTGDFREIVHDQLEACGMVTIIANADLKDRTRQAAGLIMSGRCGDPRENGFNQRLARQLEVSPQRASQIMADLRKSARAA